MCLSTKKPTDEEGRPIYLDGHGGLVVAEAMEVVRHLLHGATFQMQDVHAPAPVSDQQRAAPVSGAHAPWPVDDLILLGRHLDHPIPAPVSAAILVAPFAAVLPRPDLHLGVLARQAKRRQRRRLVRCHAQMRRLVQGEVARRRRGL